MFEKKAKFRIHTTSESKDEQVDKKSKLPSCGTQMSMVGVRILGPAASKKNDRGLKESKKSSYCSLLPDEIGRKNLVSSPETVARYKNLMQVENIENCSTTVGPEIVKLPELTSQNIDVCSRKSASLNRHKEVKGKLDRLSADIMNRHMRELGIKSRKDQQYSERNEFKLPGIKQKNGFAANTTFSSLDAYGRVIEKQIAEREHKTQIFLPSLKQPCELTGRGNLFSANTTESDLRHSRRGSRPTRSGKQGRRSSSKTIELPSLQEQVPFDEQLVGKSCLPVKRAQKPRQKSGCS